MNNLAGDVYFDDNYINLYLKENESIFKFLYEEQGKRFSQVAIKRPIKKVGNSVINDGLFDLETVYGYGGFIINTNDDCFIKKALNKYEDYCLENNVIAEFIRYHPFQNIPNIIQNWFSFFIKDRETVFIDLSLSKEERWATYGKKTRNILRRCSEQLEFKEVFNIKSFSRLYFETMKKNSADNFYFFSENYFNEILKLENTKLFEVSYNNIPISVGFFMFGDSIVHYHLSGNDTNFSGYNGNYFLLDSVCDFIKNEYDLKYFHLGGGRTNAIDDSLLRFKKKFSSSTKSFYIGGKIYNESMYKKYNLKWLETNEDIQYFLKYRLNLEGDK